MLSKLFKGRKKGAHVEDALGTYVGMFQEFLCDFTTSTEDAEEQQRKLIQFFNAWMCLHIGSALMSGRDEDERIFYSLAKIHVTLMGRVEDKLGYPPHQTPYNFVENMANAVREITDGEGPG